MLVFGQPERYADRHPGPLDVACVIEIAASSLERDRTTKQRIYAQAGVAQYVSVNLVEQRVEVYEEPKTAAGHYGVIRLAVGEEPVTLRLGDAMLDLPASDLLG